MAPSAEQFDPEVVFKEARDDFLNSLQPLERTAFAKCVSAEELIKQVQQMPALAGNPSLLRRTIGKVRRLSDILSPYFDTVGLFVSSHPEFAAIAWGAVRLVLQLASNFDTFFGKLTDTLEQIGMALPKYRFILNLLQAKYNRQASLSDRQRRLQQSMDLSIRIKKSICVLYKDILRFMLVVVRVFTKSDGSSKSSIRVGFGLLWQPYDLKFKNFLEQLATHRTLLESEIQCFSLSQADEIEEVLAKEAIASAAERVRVRLVETAIEECLTATEQASYATLKELKFSVLKTWLKAPSYADDLERALELRELGTADWLFSEEMFSSWQDSNINRNGPGSPGDGWLWIHGNPGCGKTVTAASVIEFVKNYSFKDCTCYFFFRAGGRDSDQPVNALSSMLTQTLKHHRSNEDLIDKFLFAMDELGSGQPNASENELWDLFKICANAGFIDNIVLDAIDECIQGEKLVSKLLRTLAFPSTLLMSLENYRYGRSGPTQKASLNRLHGPAPAPKVVLFSRPHLTSLSELFPDKQLAIKHRTSGDIDVFLTRKIKSLRDKKLLPATIDVPQTVFRLAHRADGMFLWARLMIQYISSPVFSQNKRLKEIERIVKPEKLDDMYDRIIQLILLQDPESRKFVQWILMWLASSKRELSAKELYETLKTMGGPEDDPSDLIEYNEFGNAIVTMCSSLVERVDGHIEEFETDSSDFHVSYRLIHLSAKEYLISFSSDRLQQLMGSEEQLCLTISRSCLLYLSKHMPRNTANSENSRVPLSAERVERVSPLYTYVTEFWIPHLPTSLFHLDHRRVSSLGQTGQIGDLYSSFLSTASQFLFGRQSLLSFIEAFYMLKQSTGDRRPLIDDLQQWAQRGLKQLPRTCSDEVPANSVFDGFLLLADYIRELEHEWGTALSETPGLVWDEVLSHNPCPLIPTTSSGAVHNLAPTVDERYRDFLSSKCLVKISEVTSDRRLLVVLSIWPSGVYNSLLENRGDDAYSCQKLQDSCSGWAALYELYDISSTPDRIFKHWIALDKVEVWIQHCHSLSERHVQFPVAISPCGHKFSILRDIFAVIPEGNGRSYKRARVTRTRLLVSFDKCANDLWCESYAGGVNSRTTRRWEVSNYLYHYWVGFNQTGTMIFFTDRTAKNHGHRHLAVFHVSVSDRIELSLASPTRTYSYLEAEPITASRHCFHPQRTLIAFTVAGSALVWDYSDASGNSELALYPFHTTKGCHRRLWLLHQSCTEGIRFSECGDQIILEYYDTKTDSLSESLRKSRCTRFIKVPQHILEDCDQIQTADQWNNTTSNTASDSSPGPLSLRLLSNNTARSSDAIIDTHGNLSSVSVNTSDGVVSLSLNNRTDGGSSQVDVELTRLPDTWQGLDETNVIVQVPDAHSDKIQMTFNRSLNLRYSMSGDADSYFPAVVERPIDSLGRSVRCNTNTGIAQIGDS
ncbi:hypothetical protein F5B22DRAFT_645589 [Xylaria bambusicola]|uniref:uncharacterized protein n=1 Tax=Xylaria bambusicola TaxID=326684 RepID=UPI002007A61E|nr:uncharacterized protein F5B22DRAFT_645589 [Xylaria bambusicola]KAI0517883.1 hypothetical protein F5B22DRAFT_645589 [Xylaria bambusicola]